MMLASCRSGWRQATTVCRILSLFVLLLFSTHPASAQLKILHQEGFNDDGDGTRYTMIGRGQEVLAVGPGMWEHNFNVDVIGLPARASEKRAAILWADEPEELDFTADSLMIWDNLIDYMISGKQAATIGFLPDRNSNSSDFLSVRLEDAGHTTVDVPPDLPDPAGLDLIIQTAAAGPTNVTDFATWMGTGYPVPVITYNGPNHDDELVSSIGAATTGGPTQVTIVEANKDHPIIGGKTGTINWVDDFIADVPLQGIGASTPNGSKVLATYVVPGSSPPQTLPALLIIEKDAPLLGAFAPIPEGTGFIVGADMNERFPDEGGQFTAATSPRVLQLNPVDVSGETGVKVSIGLAATDVDFESPDFLRIAYSEDPNALPEDFITLAQFDGMAPGVLTNPDLGPLNPNAFTDFTFEIPDAVNNLVIRIEAFSTFPNEVVGFDNIRIFTGEELAIDPLDCNADGVVDFADLDCSNAAGNTNDLLAQLNLIAGDLDGQGGVAFPDFLILSANFGQALNKYTEGDIDGMGGVAFPDFLALSANFGKSAGAAAAAVPEPASLTVLALGGMLLCLARRRRR